MNHEPTPLFQSGLVNFVPVCQCLPWNCFLRPPLAAVKLFKKARCAMGVSMAWPWGDFPISVRWQPEMASCLPANLTPWMCWKRTCRLGRLSLGWNKCELFCHVLPWLAWSSGSVLNINWIWTKATILVIPTCFNCVSPGQWITILNGTSDIFSGKGLNNGETTH